MILWYLIAPRSSRTSRYSPSSGKHFSRVDDRNVAPSLHQSCLHGARVIVWSKYRLYINRFCTVAVFFSVVRVVYFPWPPAIGFFRVICSRLELCFESQRRNSKGRGGKKKEKKKEINSTFVHWREFIISLLLRIVSFRTSCPFILSFPVCCERSIFLDWCGNIHQYTRPCNITRFKSEGKICKSLFPLFLTATGSASIHFRTWCAISFFFFFFFSTATTITTSSNIPFHRRCHEG